MSKELKVACANKWASAVLFSVYFWLMLGIIIGGTSRIGWALMAALPLTFLLFGHFAYPITLRAEGGLVRLRTFLPWKSPIKGLRVSFDSTALRLTFESSSGSRKRVGSSWWPIIPSPELAKILQALHKEGADIHGFPLPERREAPDDFRVTTRLTHALNWRWDGCQTGPTDDQAVRAAQEQALAFSADSLLVTRQGREVLRLQLAGAKAVKPVKPHETRILLDAGGEGVWPLADWNAPELSAIEAALIERGVAVEDRVWEAPERKVVSAWK